MVASQRYTQEAVERALDVVRSKQMSLRKASKVFGIPYATLGDKLWGRRPVTASPRTVLTSEEETKLGKWMVELLKRGFARTRNDLRDMVKRILDDRGEKKQFSKTLDPERHGSQHSLSGTQNSQKECLNRSLPATSLDLSLQQRSAI